MSIDLIRNKTSRRTGLAFSWKLIEDYERDQLYIRELNPPYVRTLEEIQVECDHYRRDAHRVWGFPYPAVGMKNLGASR